VDLGQDLPRLGEGLPHLDAEAVGEIGLDAADPAVGDGQPRARDVLDQLPQELARLDHVQEHREGAQLHGGGADARQVVADPRDLAHHHPDVLAPLGDLDVEELLDGGGVGEVVDERRDVVQPVRVGDGVVVGADLAVLLEGTMEIADLHVRLDDRLTVQLREDPDDAVHGRVRRAHVDVEVLAARAGPGALSEEYLARGTFGHS
jgi:hypothetical protein